MGRYKDFSYEEYVKNHTKKIKENPLDRDIPYKNMVEGLEDILSVISDNQKLELRRKEYIKNGK